MAAKRIGTVSRVGSAILVAYEGVSFNPADGSLKAAVNTGSVDTIPKAIGRVAVALKRVVHFESLDGPIPAEGTACLGYVCEGPAPTDGTKVASEPKPARR